MLDAVADNLEIRNGLWLDLIFIIHGLVSKTMMMSPSDITKTLTTFIYRLTFL